MTWNLTDAKNKLSEVLTRADEEGTQIITRRDRDYVLIPGDRYRKLTGETPGFLDLLLDEGPRFGDDTELPERTVRPIRDPEL
jgi:prevent-host-death family protein